VIGSLGIGKFALYEFTDSEKQRLRDFDEKIAEHFYRKSPAMIDPA
jgi:hypothetical protein